MEHLYKYNDLVERQAWVIEAEGKGLRMLHDTFDNPKWKRGDPIVGTMIFTDEPEPQQPLPEPVRDIFAEIDEIKAEIAQLKGS